MPSMNLRDEELAMVVVAARYDMPQPGSLGLEPLSMSDEQLPVPLGDEYNGEPGASSLKWEGQGCCTRPGTDIYVSGHACAPRGQKVTQLPVGVQVGSYQRSAMVFGERWWKYGLSGRVPSTPEPFERVPLVYERCFGGTIEEARGRTAQAIDRNPVGRGIHDNPSDHPLPNIENPNQLIASPQDRPLPQGFGPVSRGWMPRRSLAGSYTQTWAETRAPLWPPDIDPRFFFAAPEGLQAFPHLEGGEEVVLVGLHPDGSLRFKLPKLRLVVKFNFSDRTERCEPLLDAVMLEPDSLSVTLILRTSVVVHPNMLSVESTILRYLEQWEQEPLS